MPTAGRLAGAITFGALAFYLSFLVIPLFAEGDLPVPDRWMVINVVAGILTGWITVGPRSGAGFVASFGVGVTGAVIMVLWVLFAHSFSDMIAQSFRKVYDTPVEALVDVFRLMIDYAALLGTPQVITTLLGGGIAAGLIANHFARNYR